MGGNVPPYPAMLLALNPKQPRAWGAFPPQKNHETCVAFLNNAYTSSTVMSAMWSF